MAIEKNSFKLVATSRLDSEFSCRSGEESISMEDTDFQRPMGVELEDDEDEYDDCDSGAGSDDFDLLELGETGEEFCQIGDQTCSIPFDLYDLSGLGDILSMDVWNDVLTDDDRLNLAKYLPDMDQEMFMRTMKELFTGCNFHFGVPITRLFEMLKGGLCEPRVALYRQGLGFIEKYKHYHVVRKHHNTVVSNLFQIKESWMKCKGYSIEEKLRVLNIMRSQKSLMYEKMEELETDSSDRSSPNLKFPTRGRQLALEANDFKKLNPKGTLKVSGAKIATVRDQGGYKPSLTREIKSTPYGLGSVLPRQTRDQFRGEDDEAGTMYDVIVQRDPNFPQSDEMDKWGDNQDLPETFMGLSVPSKTGIHTLNKNKTVNQLPDIKVLTAKPSNTRFPYDYGKKLKQTETTQQIPAQGSMSYGKSRAPNFSHWEGQLDIYDGGESFRQNKSQKYAGWNVKNNKGRTISTQNGGRIVAAAEGMKMLAKGEETESDSSEQFGADEDNNPLMRSKWAYPSSVSSMNNGEEFKMAKFGKKDKKKVNAFDGASQISRKNGHFGDKFSPSVEEIYKQKGKTHGSNNGGHIQELYRLRNTGLVPGEQSEILQVPLLKPYPAEKKQKGEFGNDYSVLPTVYLNDYAVDNVAAGRTAKKGRMIEAFGHGDPEMNDIRLLGCNSVSKKRKVKDDLMFLNVQEDHGYLNSSPHQPDDILRRKSEEEPVTEMAEEEDAEASKFQKKPFTLITPTVHTGFSFSIIHLLSAVRMAMITLLPEDSMDIGRHHHVNGGRQNLEVELKQEDINGDRQNLPSLTTKDIVNRVKSNPGDPCIIETQEPLQDLVRGVLKIFSSKTAPLGAKGWKALVAYEKPIKTWTWVGPVSQNPLDHEAIEEVTSPEAWGLPHKMLVKLVDAFANWLKSGQETLQKIGSLPPPPLMNLNLDEKERFRDLKAQKSLNTISPSSEEVRDYFRKEELLRYLIPDRSFAYTAIDGKKSTVAPSKKGAGKPTSKARDHFMLKRDRPPHVTILCLVRDAAARLPGSIGTRADVCTLIRDSQYIVEDVSDAHINQIVSGALDRLHYERDPCVQYDGERKLWVYLHREREEEDFDDDGTSSTKKWKRQKKDLSSDINLDASYVSGQGANDPNQNFNDATFGREDDFELLNTGVS